MVKIIGFDVSSSRIGYGVIDTTPLKLVDYGNIKPLNSKYNIFERLRDVYIKIGELCSLVNPDYIGIEDILLHMKGKSSAKTITILSIFNRTVGLSCYEKTNIIPELIPVSTIRKTIKDYYKLDNIIKKEDMPIIISKYLYENFEYIYDKNNNISNITYDQSDGIAVSWSYALRFIK